jgi:diaminopimelate epimerase
MPHRTSSRHPFAPERPRAGRAFFKAHGLGNDYLVVERGEEWLMDRGAVAAVCHRTRGVGADGIIWLDPDTTPFHLRMFNPDGGEFERSGNGLRILAAHLHRTGRVGEEPFRVSVGGETVEMHIRGAEGGHFDLEVEMGTARVGAAAVALEGFVDGASTAPGQGRIETVEGPVVLVPVSVGNPHAVLWGGPEPWGWRDLDDPAATVALRRFGPAVATHAGFADGVNVQLAVVESPTRVRALVWERGVGHTSASGTSACAVAVAAVTSGRIPPGEIEIVMEGGTLRVGVSPELGVRLRGPVEAVMTGFVEPGLVGG